MNKDLVDQASTAAGIEAKQIASQLIKEGGRGAVLLGAARLDLALEKLLKGVMHSHIGGDDNLFDPDRPLGTFSAKISLAYRLSLIDKSTEHALQMVRRVRNDFAHSFEDASLTEQANKNRLSKPYSEARRGPVWGQIEHLLTSQKSVPVELAEFVCLVVTLVSFMEACTHVLQIHKPLLQVRLASGVGASS